ncbi:MAG: peptidoglycan-binding protein [Clostridiales bacterium]|jgi:hypothetical protein|nr:peptidoglycan-binding protein [Clostridiales bacterium]
MCATYCYAYGEGDPVNNIDPTGHFTSLITQQAGWQTDYWGNKFDRYANGQITSQTNATGSRSYNDYTISEKKANKYAGDGGDAARGLCTSYNCVPGEQVEKAIADMEQKIKDTKKTANETIKTAREGNIKEWEAANLKTTILIKRYFSGGGIITDEGVILPELPDSFFLKMGSTGDIVKYLQYLLYQAGYNISIDGLYGLQTFNAVAAFQDKYKLEVDGIVGSRVWNKLAGIITKSDDRQLLIDVLDEFTPVLSELAAATGTAFGKISGFIGIIFSLLMLKGDEPDSAKLYRRMQGITYAASTKVDSFFSTLQSKYPNNLFAPIWFDDYAQPSFAGKNGLRENDVYTWAALNVYSGISFTKRPWGVWATSTDSAQRLAKKIGGRYDGWSDQTGFVKMQQYTVKCGTSAFKIWFDYKI